MYVDPDLEGDLMWWQCRQPPCLLHSGVILFVDQQIRKECILWSETLGKTPFVCLGHLSSRRFASLSGLASSPYERFQGPYPSEILSFFCGDPHLFNTRRAMYLVFFNVGFVFLEAKIAWLVVPHFRQYAEFVPYRNGSHIPLWHHHGFTVVQADPELANADIGSTADITPKKYGDSTTGGKAPNLVGVVRGRDERGEETAVSLLHSRLEKGTAAVLSSQLSYCDWDRGRRPSSYSSRQQQQPQQSGLAAAVKREGGSGGGQGGQWRRRGRRRWPRGPAAAAGKGGIPCAEERQRQRAGEIPCIEGSSSSSSPTSGNQGEMTRDRSELA
ncbi:hypothetical protein Taro_043881 [Colocasia esculenta]|uniref:Uncharacterized protein n=1 Tax=Colocasia esculenta TaxID=4460 RepID=A0A843X4P8_COLES|nr:hypothetical protein [Colocasia esculenta]